MRALTLSALVTLALALALTLTLGGCSSAPRLDTSSEEAIDASLARMNAELPSDEKRQELAQSIAVLTMSRTIQTGITTALKPDSPTISRTEVYQPLAGKTADQIIAEAKPALAKMAGEK
jgi:hypothetical protein